MRASRSTALVLALVACAMLAIGSIGPWQTSVLGSESGLDGGGLYTFLLALTAALLCIARRPWPAVVGGLGFLCLAVASVNVVDVAGMTREPAGLGPPSKEVAWGLWLTWISALALTALAYLIHREVSPQKARSSRRQSGLKWARFDPALVALFVLLGIGLILRVWLTVAWNPAFTGYSDSGIYFQGAFESIWADPIRMVGYPMFLTALHAIHPHLIAVVVVQHAMGLAAAVLLFLAVRRSGGPAWLGLAPAAVIAVGGDELFIEHAALSDALFVFLIAATLYATVRASEDSAWWGAAAGLCVGLAVWDRTVGLGLVVVVALWLAFQAGRPSRRTLAVAGLTLAVALSTVGAYAVWRSAAADLPGTLTSNNAWNLYGRVAPWADCEEFTAPAGTEQLCQRTPAPERGYHSGEEYIYSGESPAQMQYGPPYQLSADPDGMERLQEWSEAAIRGQFGDYLNAVWLDTRRLFSPNAPSYGALTADAFVAYLLSGVTRNGENEFVEYWQSKLYPDESAPHHGSIAAFETWEAITRIVNLWMVLALVLCVVGPFVLTGRARAEMLLFATTALVLLIFPIVSKGYDYRFAIPAYAPLAAAAVLAAWGLVVSINRSNNAPRKLHEKPRPAPDPEPPTSATAP